MQHTSIPFTLAFGPQGCMAEVKGRVVAVWCHAELPRVFGGLVDFPLFIPHNLPISTSLILSLDEIVLVGSDERLMSGKYRLSRRSEIPTVIVATLLRGRRSGPAT